VCFFFTQSYGTFQTHSIVKVRWSENEPCRKFVLLVAVLATRRWHPPDKSNFWRSKVFGEKESKLARLFKIGQVLQGAEDGVTQAELARQVGVTRATIHKDLSIIQEKTGILPAEDDDGRLYWWE
jgi:hypothetical protein